MNRKRIFGFLVIVVGLLVTGFVVTNVLAGPDVVAAKGKMKEMTIKVNPAVITINVGDEEGSASYFLTVGTITHVNGETASGIYYCRGVFTGGPVGAFLPPLIDGTPSVGDGLTYVDQYFQIDGQGTIFASGDEGGGLTPPMVVQGGTGRFQGVEGTKTQEGIPFSPDFEFLSGGGEMTHTFKINRTPKK